VSITRLTGTQCLFASSGGTIPLDDSAAMHLYRIAQEAANNAMKHGKARRIVVSLAGGDLETTLRIEDDGVGISKTSNTSGGMGLNIMQYRARLSGGDLQVEALPNGGTIVSCTVRLPQTEFHERAA
jgi:signal transduction histidine kinase